MVSDYNALQDNVPLQTVLFSPIRSEPKRKNVSRRPSGRIRAFYASFRYSLGVTPMTSLNAFANLLPLS